MKTMPFKTILYLSLIFLFSCSKKEEADCPDDLACTEIFVSISVQIRDSKNETIKLSKTTTEIEGVNPIITKTDFSSFFDNYVIINDASKNDIKKSGSKVTFKGYNASNLLIVNEEYIIGHDCCHVVKLSGKDNIIVN